MKGIDVSEHQGLINFAQVKKSGIEFAMVRLGSIGRFDRYAIRNIEGFLRAGIKVGCYQFCYALDPEEARQDAAQVIQMLKPYSGRLEFPIAYDLEASGFQEAGKMGSEEWANHMGRPFTKDTRTEIVRAFLHELEGAGFYAMNYLNLDYILYRYDMNRLKRYDTWLAQPGAIAPARQCGIWQYSWTGNVEGIQGDVDMNIAYKDYPSLIRMLGLNGFKKETPQSIEPAPVTPVPAPQKQFDLVIPCSSEAERKSVQEALKKAR